MKVMTNPVPARLLDRAISSVIPAVCLAASLSLNAQTASPIAPTKVESEILELSPFEVTAQKTSGYAATNTLAGTRLNSEIANTPVSLSVLTRDFLADIGATDASKAIEYALNAGNNTNDATGNGAVFNAFNYQVRGFTNATNSRNYFGSGFIGESYNVDYLELSRGPNSVLFGIASPGGTFNAAIKRARPGQNVTTVQLRAGSFDEYRGTLDIARTFGQRKNFALRLNLLEHRANGFYEFEKLTRRAGTLAATWRPFSATTVRVELERAKFFDARARPFPVGNRFNDWVAAGSVLHTVPTSRPARTTATFSSGSGGGIFFSPQSAIGSQPVAFSGNYFRASDSAPIRGGLGTDIPGIFDTAIVPRSANLLGPGNGNTSNQKVAGVFVEQRVGRRLFLEAAYYYQGRNYLNRQPTGFNDNDLYIDVSANDPAFDPTTGAQTGYQLNPNVGKYRMRGTYQEDEYYQRQDDFRLTASYDLNTGRFGHHRLAGLLQHTTNESDRVSRREVNVSPSRQYANLTDGRNAIIRLNYIDFNSPDPRFHGMQSRDQQPIVGRLLGTPGVEVRSGLANVGWAAAKNTIDSAIVASQSSFFKERLWFTGGIRRDVVTNNSASALRDPSTLEYIGVDYNRPDDLDVSDTTSSLGGVFHVTPWLSIYGNRSDNFNTQGNAILFGETGINAIAGNTKGEGRDIGIRSKLFGGKVNLSLGHYKTSQVGQYFFIAGTYGAAVNNIWSALGQQGHPLLRGNDLRDVSGQGIEFELTANPTRNLRLTLNYNRVSKYSETRPFSNLTSYLNQNRELWLAPANASLPANSSYGTTVQAIWDTIQRQLATDTLTNGRMPFAFRPESANAFARYSFTTGPLKGFAIGGGVNWRGPMVLAYRQNDANQQVRGYEQIFFNGLLSYERKFFGKYNTTFQLNGDNLLDFNDPFPRRIYWFDDAQGPSITYQYPYQLRRWSLSMTVRL